MLDRFPKSAIIGAAVVIILLALVVVFKTVTGGEMSRYPSRKQMNEMQKGGQQTGGHTSLEHNR